MKINFKKIVRRTVRVLIVIAILHLLFFIFLYFKQEKFFFNPKILKKDYTYQFEQPFEEINIPVAENVDLNALLFKTKEPSKGIILYYHGNAGAIHDWGKRAPLYLDNGYDILFFDYRGYGKSDGAYENTEQLLNDALKVYDHTKKSYAEEDIIVLGYSLGSGLATYAASKNNPKMLILNAPYYSWKILVSEQIAPPVPEFLVRYDIPTFQYIQAVTCPVKIFSGTRDFLVNPELNAKKLKDLNPQNIELNMITDGGHNGLHITKAYYDALKRIL